MADIFLSYNETDRKVAHRLAAMLGSVGWTVWWDRRIPAGETWRSVLEDALENMRCMVVVWSKRSVESEWVYEEASEGRRLGKLVPVMIEPVRPPAGFREIQAADLSGWDGSAEFEGARGLIADLELLLGKPDPAALSAIPKAEEREIRRAGSAADRGRAYDDADRGRAVEPPAPAPTLSPRMPVWAVGGAILLVGGAASVGLYLWTASPDLPPVASTVHMEPSPVSLPAQPEPTAPVVPPITTEVTKDATVSPSLETPSTPATSTAVNTTVAVKPLTAKPARPKPIANPRCSDLLARVQLGEALSDEAQTVFQKECSQ